MCAGDKVHPETVGCINVCPVKSITCALMLVMPVGDVICCKMNAAISEAQVEQVSCPKRALQRLLIMHCAKIVGVELPPPTSSPLTERVAIPAMQMTCGT